jgi:hypothetical protein
VARGHIPVFSRKQLHPNVRLDTSDVWVSGIKATPFVLDIRDPFESSLQIQCPMFVSDQRQGRR